MSRAISLRFAVPAVVLAALGPNPVAAQTCPLAPGCTRTLEQTIPFAAAGQSLWGPSGSETLLEGKSLTLFDQSWDASDDDESIQSFSGWWGTVKFGGSADAAARGRIGAFFDVNNFGQAAVDVDYPVQVHIGVPEANTFRAGEAVTITTSWAPADGARLATTMWAPDVELRGVFGMHNSAGFTLCVVSCTDKAEFFPTMDVPETPFSIFRTGEGKFGLGDQEPTDAASFIDFLASTLTGVTAYVSTPDPIGTVTGSGTPISASGSDQWAVLDVDIDSFLRFVRVIPGLPFPPLGACLPLEDYDAFDLCYETVDLDSQFRIIQDEDISFDAGVEVRVDFPVELGFHVTDPSGNVTLSGTDTSVSFPVGHSLTVYTAASVQPVALSPTFSLTNTISRTSDLRMKYWMTNQELQLSFDMAKVSSSSSRSVDKGHWRKKSCPSFLDDPVGNVACEAANVAGEVLKWWEWVSNWVTETVTHTANAIDFDVGPLVRENFAQTESTIPLFERSWNLGGFGDAAGPTLTLDPEDPGIAVRTTVANSLLATGLDEGTLTQTITVENTGDVPLNAAEILDALAAGGLSLANLQSFDLTVAAGFDGAATPGVLAGGQTLPVGGSGTVTLRWAAVPGLHVTTVKASGTSPIDTGVSDEAPLAFGWVPMDIKPKKIERRKSKKNGKSEKAKLPVELYGSPGIPVSDIDPSSLQLEGAPILRWEIEDEDGAPELKVKFGRQAVLDGLDARRAAGIVAPSIVAPVSFGLNVRSFDVDEIAGALLGSHQAGAEDRLAMDRAGNGNGRLDVGDLRAALLAGDQVTAAGKKSKDGFEDDEKDKAEKPDQGKPEGTPYTLILTGSLVDGTPIWAEASVLIRDKETDR